MTTQNTQNTQMPSLSQKVNSELTNLQNSLHDYRNTTADAIVNELDIVANMKLIKDLTKKKLQEKYLHTNLDELNALDFGASSLRSASQRILSLQSHYGTNTPEQLPMTKQISLLESKTDEDSTNILVEELMKQSKQEKKE